MTEPPRFLPGCGQVPGCRRGHRSLRPQPHRPAPRRQPAHGRSWRGCSPAPRAAGSCCGSRTSRHARTTTSTRRASAVTWPPSGIDWDGPVVRQSTLRPRHEAVLADLEQRGLTYPCYCSRREVREAAAAPARAASGCVPGDVPRPDRRRAPPSRGGRAARRAPAAIGGRGRHHRRPAPRRGQCRGRRRRAAPQRRRARLQPRRRRRRRRPGDRGGGPRRRPAELHAPAGPSGRPAAACRGPTWAHVPLVLGQDGERLAKRHGAVTLEDLAAEGRGPAAVRSEIAASLGLADARRGRRHGRPPGPLRPRCALDGALGAIARSGPHAGPLPSGRGHRRRGHRGHPGRDRHRRCDHPVHAAAAGGPAMGRAVPLPRREDALVQREPGAGPVPVLGLPGAGRRHHVHPRGRAPRLRGGRRAARRPGRDHPALLRPGRGRDPQVPVQAGRRGRVGRRVVPPAAAVGPRRGRRPQVPPRAGAHRGRGAGLPGGLGARRLGRDGEGAAPARRRREGHRARVPQPRGPPDRRLPGPDPVPDLRRQRRCGGLRRPGDARRRGPEVQEHAGDPAVPEVEAPLRAQLVEGPHRHGRPGHRVRGLHGRDRVRPGGAARPRWPPAARPSPRSTCGCCGATPARSCSPSTPTPPGRPRPSGSTSGSGTTRSRSPSPTCRRASTRPTWPAPIPNASPPRSSTPCRSSSSASTACWARRASTRRRAGPRPRRPPSR